MPSTNERPSSMDVKITETPSEIAVYPLPHKCSALLRERCSLAWCSLLSADSTRAFGLTAEAVSAPEEEDDGSIPGPFGSALAEVDDCEEGEEGEEEDDDEC